MAVHRKGQIILDTPKHVYYSGTMVTGCVEFQFETVPVTFSVLQVTLVGEANVKWSEQESVTYNGERRYRNVDYLGQEEYVNFTQVLAGGYGTVLQVTLVGEANVKWSEQESVTYNGERRYRNVDYLGQEEYVNFTQVLAGGYGTETIQLPPGTHKYPFQLQIPPNVPSSFDGARGKVQYIIKAIMSNQQRLIVDELVQVIDVVMPFNLNLGNPKVKEPIEFLLEDEVCGCFCNSNTISIKIRLPVSGYCPGQTIPVEIAIDNQSSIEVRRMIFQLFKKERYVTQRPQSEFISPEKILVTVNKGAVLSGAKRTFTIPVVVPDMVVPNLETCNIIDVGYFFRAIVKLSGCNSDMTDDREICLGLVPLDETVTEAYVHPMAQSLPDTPIPDPVPIQQETQTNFNNAPEINRQFQEISMPLSDSDSNSYFRVQISKSSYSSSDPSKNYNIGFTMSGPGSEMTPFISTNMGQFETHSDLRINLPPFPAQNAPSAPPPYLINK